MNKLEIENKLKNNKLPEGWAKVKLGEIIIENIKSRFKVENADNSGRYPFFTSGEAILSDSNYLVDYENVFLATGGVANIKYYKGKANYSADTYCLQAKITTKYLYYFLLKNLTKIDYKYFSGSGLKHLQKNDFKKEILILPSSYYEQQKIVEILETVDETIEKTDAIIKKYKRIKQGLMQDLLTRGITAFEFEKDKLIAAVKKVFKNGDHRFGREENLVSHLSRYLNEFFPGWDVDSEVEKNNDRQRPDIIIHKRRMDENLFAIEVKKNENLNAIKKDIEKLEDVMLGDYHYEDAVFIGFDIDNFEDVFKLSEKVNFILVSKNGEIKVKSRVRRFKDSFLGRIPEEWGVNKLENKLIDNIYRYPTFYNIEFIEEGIGVLKVENLSKDGFINKSLDTIMYISKETNNRFPRTILKENDLVMAVRGATIGKIARIGKRFIGFNINPNLIKISTNQKKLNPVFFWQYMNSAIGKSIFESKTSSTAKETITVPQFLSIETPLPPLPEQHRIASVLSQIDDTIEKEKKYKEKFERIKKGLMENLLTGKVGVNHLIKEGVESV